MDTLISQKNISLRIVVITEMLSILPNHLTSGDFFCFVGGLFVKQFGVIEKHVVPFYCFRRHF